MAHRNRGMAYDKKGDFAAEIADCTKAIRLDPNDAVAHNNLGWAYENKGDYDQAIAEFTAAIRLNPKDAVAHRNRGFVHKYQGEYDEAIAEFTEAIRLNPKDAVAYTNRGTAHNGLGQWDRAIADCTEAIRLDPKRTPGIRRSGPRPRAPGQYERAIADDTEAIRLSPKDAEFHNGLAWLLATCPEGRFRDGPGAIQHATTACELTKWNNPYWLDTLAAAYAEAGQFDKAVEFQQKALDLAKQPAAKELYREHLKLYREGKPYREPARK